MANLESKKEVVIYCEGKTERDYLKQVINKYFSRIASRIMVKDCEHNHAKPLVEHVLRRRKVNPNKQTQYWCVFDRDDNNEQDLQFCREKEGQIRLFYSNPCVEFWFYLHGAYRDEAIGRQKHDMIPALKKVKGFEGYAKPGFDYEPLWNPETFKQAKNNAKKRLFRYLTESDTSIFISRKSDPITTIHHLIEALETLEQQQETPDTMSNREEIIYLGAGCFWGVEAALAKLPGVLKTSVGYMGGTNQNPTYKTICYGDTNHAEVVAVTYNPSLTKLSLILHIFFNIHDATQLNRQGPDFGTQYRSCIFTTTDEQLAVAKNSLTIAQGNTAKPIVTTIEPAPTYWEAEAYHQQYFAKNPYHPNCHLFNLDAILASFIG